MSAPQQPSFNAPAQGKSLVLVVPAVVLDLGFISTIFSLLYYAWGVVLLVVAIMTFLGKWIYEKDANGVPTV